MGNCKISGHQIHYNIISSGKEETDSTFLVFLHEGLGSVAQWKDFPAEISQKLGLPALVYDRYGYGQSEILKEKRPADYLRTAAMEELPGLLQHLGISGPLILIGHSDGATIALMFASRYPARVKVVVSEAAHVMLEDISRTGVKNSIKLFRETKLRDFLERYHGGRAESMFYGWAHTWISEEMDAWDMKNELCMVTSPVLAIQGENDEFGSPEQLCWIEKYCPGPVELLHIPDCGHVPHFQKREMVSEKIISFVRNH